MPTRLHCRTYGPYNSGSSSSWILGTIVPWGAFLQVGQLPSRLFPYAYVSGKMQEFSEPEAHVIANQSHHVMTSQDCIFLSTLTLLAV